MSQFGKVLGSVGHAAGTHGDVIQDALVAVREHLGMEVAYLSEFVDARSVFRRVDAPGLEHLIKVGDSHSLDDVYCNHILEGRLPELMADTSLQPLALSMPITAAVPIGSHASIPILLPDGRPFGMFCCLSPKANPTLNPRDLDVMRVFAGLAAKQVHSEIERDRKASAKQENVDAVMRKASFKVVFQPIFSLASMEVISLEALCRFESTPYRSPDLWFRDAADVGRGTDLELDAIRAALAYFDTIPQHIGLSINASPETVVSGRLADAIDPRYLGRTTIEVTEHAKVADYAEIHRALQPLRAAGLKVAIDDAGAGYSGLQHIIQMAPDVIKMDMSLTRGIDHDRARRALATAMIYYARETGSTMVAEGIETPAELETLSALGTNAGQGYLLGKPASFDEIGPLLRSKAASSVLLPPALMR